MPDQVVLERRSPSEERFFRAARFDISLPLSFRTDGGIEEGHCVNVSASGLMVIFNRPVELFTVGEISMVAGEYVLNITGRVARAHNGDHGLSFQIDTDIDRLTIQVLVNFASANQQPKAGT